ncbi:SafA/ExsA family spore coat assembly protein [Oceanobacillus sp. J11TS1]|uniref:SafA/ExsA family spore coat assembly protein n=1 Tax=Oceanobacillus sp. J11TS1 TaxID=2807191 RepID=UPI001B1B9300|nr:SafA/ExsA family spore coat assembly protein [Oceanobacillus sp. J11TS1]GIO21800.1 hypothetical protein J11TS1_03810 [Oceanobacillus sp. J11TS1]
MKIHIVQLGDTLWKLAKKNNVSFEELKKINSHLANPEKLMPGMKIKIPSSAKPVQKGKSKKEQPTAGSKKEMKVPKKEETKPAKKEEKKKTEHPFKQKSPTPIAVLKEDDHKEKKKGQFDGMMPKMPQKPTMPQMPSMPILKKEMKAEKKPTTKKEAPKQKKEKKTQVAEKPKQQQSLCECETQQQQLMPCEPVPFCPPMMPVFYMPCPPMPYDPYAVQPGMQHGFPMMPPMGDCGCGCGGPNQFQPMHAPFNPFAAGFNEGHYEGMNQQYPGMMPYQQQPSVNQGIPSAGTFRPENNEAAPNQNADSESYPPFHSNHLPTSAPFMGTTENHQQFTENQHYSQSNQAPSSNPSRNSLYPKPPFYPKRSEDKHDSSS